MLAKSSERTPMRMSRLSKVAGLAAASLALLAGTARGKALQDVETKQQAPAAKSELAEVRLQLVEIDRRIDEVEKKAMLEAEPMEAEAEYVEQLKKAAIEKSPEIEAKLLRQEALISELDGDPQLKLSAEERSPEFTEKLDEFMGLRNEINPVVQSVSSQPELRESYQEFQDTVVKKMKELEPQTDQLFAQREDLANRFQELSKRVQ